MPNIVEGVKGFDHLDTNVTLEDLRIVDPRVENEQVTKFTKGSIFFCCLASTICLTVLVATGIVWKQRQDEIQLETMSNHAGMEDNNSSRA